MNIDDMKSYKTEANLDKAVAVKFGHPGRENLKYLTVCNRSGRFVAVFPYGWNPSIPVGFIVHAGFLVVG